MQNCKHMTRLNSLHPSLGACKIANKNKKTTTLCLRHSGPVGLLGFLGFLVFVCFFFVFLVLSFCMNVSLTWLPVCFCEHFAVLSLLTLPFPIIPHLERSAHAYSATPLDIIQMCMFFLTFSCFGHPRRKLLKEMGETTTQPRLENIISKQVSAWPLTFLFKPSNICLMQYFFREYNIPSIKPILSMKWYHSVQSPYIREYSMYLTWMQNHVQRQLCKVPLDK